VDFLGEIGVRCEDKINVCQHFVLLGINVCQHFVLLGVII
jgi:hypothetical protein